jgi:CheY-like chemotaxis protein
MSAEDKRMPERKSTEVNMTGVETAKGKVLVVDVEAETRTFSADLLTAAGYDVVAASSIEEGLQAVEKTRPAVVLFSSLRPPAGAIDFARRLALSPSVRFTPVILVTALNEFQIQSFLNGVPGVRRIVPSPCEPDALRAEIAHAIQHVRR